VVEVVVTASDRKERNEETPKCGEAAPRGRRGRLVERSPESSKRSVVGFQVLSLEASSMPIDADELSIRTDRLDAYLSENDLEAVWFAQPTSFAWLTGGSNVVARGGLGVGAVGYAGDGDLRLVTNNIEVERLLEEELPGGVEAETYQWYESSLAESVAGRSPTPAAADFDVPDFESIDPTNLRQPLTEGEIERYRELGADTAEAVESVAREVESEDTETDVAAALRAALAARDINSPVALVGGERRAQEYRHYTPKDVELGGYALLSVTAERGGLHASATRTVAFDPPEWLADRHQIAMFVEATALGATRAVARRDGTAGDAFHGIQAAYEHFEYPDEWRKHHQGGAAGYAGREWKGTPTADEPVHAPMAYAWNPTVQGAKSEDTVLVSEDGFEVLTETGEWPTQPVDAYDYDAVVDRHLILDRS
jgi:Xaa-Pro aminopeptidase